MLEEARSVPADSRIECEVCVVGAGAAGISLARQLAATRHRVVVLESGGFEFEERTHDLTRGSTSGLPYDLSASRLRFLGGSTNHWAGMCRPLDPEDFAEREWIKDSGWPIRREDLDPFYARAHPICDLGPYRYDLEWWLARLPGVRPLIDNQRFRTALFQIGPGTRFGTRYRQDLARAKNLRVLLHANATNVRSGGGRVRGVDVATLSGKRFAVDAAVVVLALGGIENPRLLLASKDPDGVGLGNGHDLVGRYFMDHPEMQLGEVVLADSAPDPQLSFFVGVPFTDAGLPDMEPPRTLLGALTPSPAVMESLRLQACAATLYPIMGDDSTSVDGEDVTVIARRSIDALVGDVEGRSKARREAREVVTIGGRTRVTNQFALLVRSEHAPNPDSRVTLTERVDRLGMPEVDLRWAVSDDEWIRTHRSVELLAREFGRLGLGRVRRDDAIPAEVHYGSHHSGTTRMHRDPSRGVVDANCQVHGVANLFVAGSSVFPTIGFANPTLTIVALALRLADHLERKVLAR